MNHAPLLQLQNISKCFGATRVLTDVSIALAPGEVVSIIGENGAGKSTLAKIIAGIVTPDSGDIFLRGRKIAFSEPRDAIAHRIGIVHQELCLADNLSVAENIFLGREATKGLLLDRESMRATVRDALSRLGLSIDPDRRVSTLSTAQKQMVEIARALSYKAEVLIFDEPTSSLSDTDAATLLNVIKTLREQGVAVLYVSHRLAEVLQISDRIVALRDGTATGELPAAEATRDVLISLIVGRELRDVYGERGHELGAPALELCDFVATSSHQATNLTVRAGEIVGIAGLVGSGRTELLQSIFGVTAPASGSLRLHGKELTIHSPAQAFTLGIALVPEERKESGVVLDSPIKENIILSVASRLARGLFRDFGREHEEASRLAALLKVRCASLDQPVKQLSGGNQQKVVIAKCLATQPTVLLMDEPTRGIDIGARCEIYAELRQLASQGMAILFVSSDLEEILGLADRVAVMSEGSIRGELTREELSEESIISLASSAPTDKIAA
jgi:ribose transport system ATP-binding protein